MRNSTSYVGTFYTKSAGDMLEVETIRKAVKAINANVRQKYAWSKRYAELTSTSVFRQEVLVPSMLELMANILGLTTSLFLLDMRIVLMSTYTKDNGILPFIRSCSTIWISKLEAWYKRRLCKNSNEIT